MNAIMIAHNQKNCKMPEKAKNLKNGKIRAQEAEAEFQLPGEEVGGGGAHSK